MDVVLVSADHVAQLEEHLLLMRRILSESVPPARRRGWLLEHCRRRGDDEREQWRALARYRQPGAAGLLSADRPRGTNFRRQDELARERVLRLLIDTPSCGLGEFQQLAQLLELLGDRLAFLCSWVLELFLEPQPRLQSEADQSGGGRRGAAAKARRGGRTPARDLRSGAVPVAARRAVRLPRLVVPAAVVGEREDLE